MAAQSTRTGTDDATEPATEPTDEWAIDTLDLDAYLARIGASARRPSAEALAALHEAHVRTIPFENVDTLSGRPPSLDLTAIQAKLVGRRRGGYCYEHSLLFAAALERLGYSVTRQTARVQPHRNGPKSHMNLAVDVDGRRYLAEVGFGAGMLRPMPVEDGVVVDQAGWRHRLVRDGRLWTLEKHNPDGWEPMQSTDDTPARPIDYEVGHHYVATHPKSPFTAKLIIMRLEPGVSRQLVGRSRIVERPDGTKDETLLDDDMIIDELRDMDIELTDDEAAMLLTAVRAA